MILSSISIGDAQSSIAIANCSSPRSAANCLRFCRSPVVSRTVNIFPSIDTIPSTDGGAKGNGVGSTNPTTASSRSSSTASNDEPICITRTFRPPFASPLFAVSASTNLGYNASREQTNDEPVLECDGPAPLCYSGPVSYTHLRAHETPEHLVCRL